MGKQTAVPSMEQLALILLPAVPLGSARLVSQEIVAVVGSELGYAWPSELDPLAALAGSTMKRR
jgi:hypothetical protein